MEFSNGDLIHLFNRGNNSQRIFFNRDNYLFFLSKIRKYILPYADILAWCLMPNHFHLLIEVIKEELPVEKLNKENITHWVTLGSPDVYPKVRTLNDSIAIMLRSYTRAINLQEKRTGALFQEGTKALCLSSNELSPAYFNTSYGTVGNAFIPEVEYPFICFNYIHNNPANNGLMTNLKEWEFSSFNDYYNNRGGNLINKKRAIELGIFSG